MVDEAQSVADLLTSASLALAALSFFSSMWIPAIDSALDVNVPDPSLSANVPTLLLSVEPALTRRAIPLAASSAAVVVALIPPVCACLSASVENVIDRGPASVLDYDAVQALFVIVWLLMASLAIWILAKAKRLWKSVRELRALRP